MSLHNLSVYQQGWIFFFLGGGEEEAAHPFYLGL